MEKMSQMSQALKSKGLVVTVLFFIFTVACIFLAGFQYRYVYHEWTSVSPYRAMGPLELTVVVVAFVVAVLGFLIFTCVSSKPLVIMVSKEL
jgi:UDP-N-acetylmuramyl pentapeptide phosphotransferase/UDP-N-acetylglucosamine-1-phosphate transferase